LRQKKFKKSFIKAIKFKENPTLEDLINQATGDRIELTDDFKYVSGDNDQGIVIAKDNLTINGNGHFIDGDNQAKIFKITGNNIVLKNIIIIFKDIQEKMKRH